MDIPAAAATSGRRALRLVEFNLHVARFAHRSWWGNAVPEGDWRAADRVEPQMSAWLLREVGLEADMDWDLHEPQKRLWLLDGATLQRLAAELALAMHRQWLLQVIDGARLRGLADAVGEPALRFVVGELPQGSFHYQSPQVRLVGAATAELRTGLIEEGARTLIALLQPAWRAVRGRAQLHFERSRGLAAVPAFEPQHCKRALELICGWLIPRRFPEWAWCL
jgi:YOP proteins translocation protein K (YscK)